MDGSDFDRDEEDLTDQDDIERRGVVWVEFIRDRVGADGERAVTYPMPGVPRVGEIVDLEGGLTFPGDCWIVSHVVWNVPAAFSKDNLEKLNLSDMIPVRVYLTRPEQKKSQTGGWFGKK